MMYQGKPVKLLDEDIPDRLKRLFRGMVVAGADDYRIIIDRKSVPIVQRFILGHELAHLYLGHIDGLHSLLRDKEREREANRHAWEYYRQWIAEGNKIDCSVYYPSSYPEQ